MWDYDNEIGDIRRYNTLVDKINEMIDAYNGHFDNIDDINDYVKKQLSDYSSEIDVFENELQFAYEKMLELNNLFLDKIEEDNNNFKDAVNVYLEEIQGEVNNNAINVQKVMRKDEEQDFYIKGLMNENDDKRLTKEGTVNHLCLTNSVEGFAQVNKIVGNTIVSEEELKSSFEVEENKVDIKLSGKNLIDKNNVEISNLYLVYTNEFATSNGLRGFTIKNPKKQTNFTLSRKLNGIAFRVYGSYEYPEVNVPGTNIKENNSSLTLNFNSGDFNYLRIMINTENSSGFTADEILEGLQLEEGTVATTYEPYKETIYTLQLNSPLLMNDEIRVVDGWLGHYHDSDTSILNGTETWTFNYGGLTAETRTETLQFFTSKFDNIISYSKPYMSDKLKNENVYSNDAVGLQIVAESQTNRLRIGHTSKTTSKFKQWLSENPVTIMYGLIESYFEPLVEVDSLLLECFNGSCIEVTSTVPVQSVSATYSSNIPSIYGVEATGIDNTQQIEITQEVIDYLLVGSLATMALDDEEVKVQVPPVIKYLAMRIKQGKLELETVLSIYPQYENEIKELIK